MPLPRHQQATLATAQLGRAAGYVLGGVPYGFFPLPDGLTVTELAQRHALALDIRSLERVQSGEAAQAAAYAKAWHALAADTALETADIQRLREEHPVRSPEVLIRTDGSADKENGMLSLGYLLGQQPYSMVLRGVVGHEGLAEREAIRTALTHARLLGYTEFRVLSDHKFHVRRYDEDLIHRGRRKSDSLERLDALVDELGGAVRFEYAPTLDTDAPHRMALLARALDRLAANLPLTRAQAVAVRRVHFARKAGGEVPY